MKEIFFGFLIISGIIVGFYLFILFIGLVTLYIRNNFTNWYSPYTYKNIVKQSPKGLFIFLFIIFLTFLFYVIGSIYLQNL